MVDRKKGIGKKKKKKRRSWECEAKPESDEGSSKEDPVECLFPSLQSVACLCFHARLLLFGYQQLNEARKTHRHVPPFPQLILSSGRVLNLGRQAGWESGPDTAGYWGCGNQAFTADQRDTGKKRICVGKQVKIERASRAGREKGRMVAELNSAIYPISSN